MYSIGIGNKESCSVEYEKAIDLPIQTICEGILNWLLQIKADISIKESDLPSRIVAGLGSRWILSPTSRQSRKRLEFSITSTQSNADGVKVKLIATALLPIKEADKQSVKRDWDENIFTKMWDFLNSESMENKDETRPSFRILRRIEELAANYEYQVPITRIQKDFVFKPQLIQNAIERFNYTGVDFVFNNDIIKVKPKPIVKVEWVEVQGEEEEDIIDKIEIPLKICLKNYGRFPTNIYIHLNTINLPSGIPYPPFTIKPGEVLEKQIKISTRVQDNEYSIDLLLCDNSNNNLEIPGSKIELRINKRTSKKEKLKNLVKSVLSGSKDLLALF